MASLLNRVEVSRAQVGPRALKDPRSREYAIQTLYALKRYAESLRCDQDRVTHELAVIDRYRHWKVLGYPSKQALLEAELTDQGRQNVQALLAATREVAPTGRPKGKEPLPFISKGPTVERLLARLKKDHPDICARLAAGEFKSIHAAARAAGLVKVKTPLDQLTHWWTKATRTERERFLAAIREAPHDGL